VTNKEKGGQRDRQTDRQTGAMADAEIRLPCPISIHVLITQITQLLCLKHK